MLGTPICGGAVEVVSWKMDKIEVMDESEKGTIGLGCGSRGPAPLVP